MSGINKKEKGKRRKNRRISTNPNAPWQSPRGVDLGSEKKKRARLQNQGKSWLERRIGARKATLEEDTDPDTCAYGEGRV